MIFLPDDKNNLSKIPEILNNQKPVEKPLIISNEKPVNNFCYTNGDPDGDGLD